uniref:Uncharacterized protein n=1 Tax=Rhizophora mucronata TaxID=61149 RepID=A0A2P2L139_RHIMU
MWLFIPLYGFCDNFFFMTCFLIIASKSFKPIGFLAFVTLSPELAGGCSLPVRLHLKLEYEGFIFQKPNFLFEVFFFVFRKYLGYL